MDNGVQRKRIAFKAMHQQGCFIIPNPWDAGSAKALASMGFQALATTSSGYAWSMGCADGGTVPLDEVLAYLRSIVQATDLPVSADFESGYAVDAEGVARHVGLALETGIAGLSIEDASGDADSPLRAIPEAVERIRAARQAIDAQGGEALLVGRAENFIVGRPDIDDTVRRLQAYAEAGADCLYAPGIKSREHVAAVVKAVAPKPVNMLIGTESEWTLASLGELGVRRISVGGALARAAWGGFLSAAGDIAKHGRFSSLAQAASGRTLDGFFSGRTDRLV